ncbi:MAG: hypothetical protein PF450_16820 [Bacteroidales bacterium]|jgi:hypothetical protein|nr:hypothetical protein [Bacteroidales bacterium]
MKRKGQLNLIAGVLAAIGSMLLTWSIVPEGELSDFFGGFLTGIGLVFMVNGIFLIVKAKMKNK